ncbi:MAG: PilZ domain-containing protein [Desulfobacterales bacterium]|nr:PilZ domain-containing protein [Desulfobacterales bacterium]
MSDKSLSLGDSIIILSAVTLYILHSKIRVKSMGSKMQEERRKFIRHLLECPVTVITSHGTMSGRARNLSGDGALICCKQSLKPRENMDLTIKFSDGVSLEVPSEVVWSDKKNTGDDKSLCKIGVRFLR